jgi:hypothetical protein
MLITLVSIKYATSDVPWTALPRPLCRTLAVINFFRCATGATQRHQKRPRPQRILGRAASTTKTPGGGTETRRRARREKMTWTTTTTRRLTPLFLYSCAYGPRRIKLNAPQVMSRRRTRRKEVTDDDDVQTASRPIVRTILQPTTNTSTDEERRGATQK